MQFFPSLRSQAQQHIRFPNITRLEFEGAIENARKPKTLSVTGLEVKQQVAPRKTPNREREQITRLRYIVPTNEGLISICTLTANRNNVANASNVKTDQKQSKREASQEKRRGTSQQKELRTTLIRNEGSTIDRSQLPSRHQSIKISYASKSRHELSPQEMSQIINKLIAGTFGVICKPSLQSFCAFVDKGNNSLLVRQVLKSRSWWNIAADEEQKKNSLCWTEFRDKRLSSAAEIRLPTHQQLEINKKQLLWLNECQNVLKLLIPQYDGRLLPPAEITKLIRRINEQSRFTLDSRQLQMTNHISSSQLIANKKTLFHNLHAWYTISERNPFDNIPLTFHVSNTDDPEFASFIEHASKLPKKKNVWIVKPGENTNRGNGITVHKGVADVKQHIENSASKHTYIIQSYIRPYLYCQRKFDIRCYALLVLINGRVRGYWYEEGYVRTASEPFSFKKLDRMIHLTNDAVQKHGENYGRYEPANKLSYQQLNKYIGVTSEREFEKEIVPQMKQLCTDVFMSTRDRLGGNRSQDAFEIFGLDFMLDEQLKPWLIELNSNPCLQLSSSLLSRIIPEMLDNAFKIALDPFMLHAKKFNLSSLAQSNRFELIFQSL